ncbi:hypothetical protein ABIF69_006088 [Bradyrhizobium japonicum]
MKLLDEIIEGAVSDTYPIGSVLRKCLVLEQQAKNDKFRAWLNKGKRVFYRTGYARGWPRRRVTPGPSSVIGTAWLT